MFTSHSTQSCFNGIVLHHPFIELTHPVHIVRCGIIYKWFNTSYSDAAIKENGFASNHNARIYVVGCDELILSRRFISAVLRFQTLKLPLTLRRNAVIHKRFYGMKDSAVSLLSIASNFGVFKTLEEKKTDSAPDATKSVQNPWFFPWLRVIIYCLQPRSQACSELLRPAGSRNTPIFSDAKNLPVAYKSDSYSNPLTRFLYRISFHNH